MRWITPDPIKQVFSVIGDVVLFIPRKIRTALFNSLAIALGGNQQAEPVKNKRPDSERFKDFPAPSSSSTF